MASSRRNWATDDSPPDSPDESWEDQVQAEEAQEKEAQEEEARATTSTSEEDEWYQAQSQSGRSQPGHEDEEAEVRRRAEELAANWDPTMFAAVLTAVERKRREESRMMWSLLWTGKENMVRIMRMNRVLMERVLLLQKAPLVFPGEYPPNPKPSRDNPYLWPDRADVTCFKCLVRGHFARDCPYPGRICFNCYFPGHIRRDCPRPEQRRRGEFHCHICNENGHQPRNCPRRDESRCYRCNEPGHLARSCPRGNPLNVDIANAAATHEVRQLASSIAALAQSPLLQRSLQMMSSPVSRTWQLASEGRPAGRWSQANVTDASGTRQPERRDRSASSTSGTRQPEQRDRSASSTSQRSVSTPRPQSRAEARQTREAQPGPSRASQNESRNRSDDDSEENVFRPVSSATAQRRHLRWGTARRARPGRFWGAIRRSSAISRSQREEEDWDAELWGEAAQADATVPAGQPAAEQPVAAEPVAAQPEAAQLEAAPAVDEASGIIVLDDDEMVDLAAQEEPLPEYAADWEGVPEMEPYWGYHVGPPPVHHGMAIWPNPAAAAEHQPEPAAPVQNLQPVLAWEFAEVAHPEYQPPIGDPLPPPALRQRILNLIVDYPHEAEFNDTSDPAVMATCRICFTRPRQVLFLPCLHLVCCRICALTTMDRHNFECPICRKRVRGVMRPLM